MVPRAKCSFLFPGSEIETKMQIEKGGYNHHLHLKESKKCPSHDPVRTEQVSVTDSLKEQCFPVIHILWIVEIIREVCCKMTL